MKSALLIIDGQNDFVLKTGALPVGGAEEDMGRVSAFIEKQGASLNKIICTLDSHHVLDIAHPSFWQKADGTPVTPFTPISYADLVDGKYTPRYFAKECFQYVKDLEDQGEFGHFIWPVHCIIGSEGAALYAPLMKALMAYEAKYGRIVQTVTKGANPLTENFGVFRANIPVPNDPSTQFNQNLVQTLDSHDVVYLAGEARSHCVINSLNQALEQVPALASKLVILTDCMSDVLGIPDPSFYDKVNAMYDDAKAKGATFATSTNV